MPCRHVSEAFVCGQSFHSAHCSVQSVHGIILYLGYNETFGFPSPPMRWLLIWVAFQFLEDFFHQNFWFLFLHIVNFISLHMTRQRLRLCTAWTQKCKTGVVFLSLHLYKCVQGCTWTLICPICPPSIHVLAEACLYTLCSAAKHSCVVSPPPWLRLKPIHITSLANKTDLPVLVPSACPFLLCTGWFVGEGQK